VPEIHLVSVFIDPDGAGGNPLAVFLDGQAIPPARRLAVTAELGYSETVFVDDLDEGRIAIFVPTSELPFAGHPTVGTAWLEGGRAPSGTFEHRRCDVRLRSCRPDEQDDELGAALRDRVFLREASAS
jgi:PhzF family phenazine biosynthesis protein